MRRIGLLVMLLMLLVLCRGQSPPQAQTPQPIFPLKQVAPIPPPQFKLVPAPAAPARKTLQWKVPEQPKQWRKLPLGEIRHVPTMPKTVIRKVQQPPAGQRRTKTPGPTATQIDPGSNIRWPAGCDAAGMVYNYFLDSCIDTSGAAGYPGVTPDGANGLNIAGNMMLGGDTFKMTGNVTTDPAIISTFSTTFLGTLDPNVTIGFNTYHGGVITPGVGWMGFTEESDYVPVAGTHDMEAYIFMGDQRGKNVRPWQCDADKVNLNNLVWCYFTVSQNSEWEILQYNDAGDFNPIFYVEGTGHVHTYNGLDTQDLLAQGDLQAQQLQIGGNVGIGGPLYFNVDNNGNTTTNTLLATGGLTTPAVTGSTWQPFMLQAAPGSASKDMYISAAAGGTLNLFAGSGREINLSADNFIDLTGGNMVIADTQALWLRSSATSDLSLTLYNRAPGGNPWNLDSIATGGAAPAGSFCVYIYLSGGGSGCRLIVAPAGNVSIPGNAPATAGPSGPALTLGTNTVSDPDPTIVTSTTKTNPLSTGGAHSFRDENFYNCTAAGNDCGYSSFDAAPTGGTGTSNGQNHLHGYQARMLWKGAGTLGDLTGYSYQPIHNGGGSVTYGYGYRVLDNSGTSTNFGLFAGFACDDLAHTGSGSFCVYEFGTQPNYFGGAIQSGGTITTGAGFRNTTWNTYGALLSADNSGNVLLNPFATLINGTLNLGSSLGSKILSSYGVVPLELVSSNGDVKIEPTGTTTTDFGAAVTTSTVPITAPTPIAPTQLANKQYVDAHGGVIAPSGDTTGATDNAAIQAALSAGTTVHLIKGSYYITGLSWTAPADLFCDANGGTFIYRASVATDFFNIHYGGGQPNNQSLGMTISGCNLVMKSGVTPTGGYAFNVSGVSTSAYLSYVHIENNNMYGLWGGLHTGPYTLSNFYTSNNFNTGVSSTGSCIYYDTVSPGGDWDIGSDHCEGANQFADIVINQCDTSTFHQLKVNGGAHIRFTGAGGCNNLRFDDVSLEGTGASGTPACMVDFGTGTVPQSIGFNGGGIGLTGQAFCNGFNSYVSTGVHFYLINTIDGVVAPTNSGVYNYSQTYDHVVIRNNVFTDKPNYSAALGAGNSFMSVGCDTTNTPCWPAIVSEDQSGAADNRFYLQRSIGGTLHFGFLDDAVTVNNDWMTVTRSGATPTQATFGEPLSATGFKVGATAGFTGTKTAGSCVLTITSGIITNVTGC